jgi:hypothetical protein
LTKCLGTLRKTTPSHDGFGLFVPANIKKHQYFKTTQVSFNVV